ncbi:MAG: cell division/cell wall cluster transcriptional repressor MraZ, partial [Chloroflexota bacterium]
MFLGEYAHTLDDKGRLTLPAKFRDSFSRGVVLTRGMDGCLYAYPRERWQLLVESR